MDASGQIEEYVRKKLPEALVPGTAIPHHQGFSGRRAYPLHGCGSLQVQPCDAAHLPGGSEAFLGRGWPVLTRPPLVPDAEPEVLGLGAAGPKGWALRAVDGEWKLSGSDLNTA